MAEAKLAEHDPVDEDDELRVLAQKAPPIHVFIGTKAQYIKTAPLLRLMSEVGLDYNLIDSGQHAAIAPALRRELGVKEPDVSFEHQGNVATVAQAMRWMTARMTDAALRPGKLRRDVFRGRGGICIVHGDTPSTLIATVAAKRVGLKVALIEAGLRSHDYLRPFPEELVRVVCMRLGDYLFAPSQWAYDNMKQMRLRGRLVNLGQNTNVEALYHSLARSSVEVAQRPYAVATVHRVETILSKDRLRFVLELLEQTAARVPLRFVMHPPTKRKLEDFGLMERLKAIQGIVIHELLPHADFVGLVAGAELVITDGGSIQEETYYLDVPCLVIRSETERQEGIGENVRISGFDREESKRFLDEYPSLHRGRRAENMRPSREILRVLCGG